MNIKTEEGRGYKGRETAQERGGKGREFASLKTTGTLRLCLHKRTQDVTN